MYSIGFGIKSYTKKLVFVTMKAILVKLWLFEKWKFKILNTNICRERRLAKTIKISYGKSHNVYRLGQVSIENFMDTKGPSFVRLRFRFRLWLWLCHWLWLRLRLRSRLPLRQTDVLSHRVLGISGAEFKSNPLP